MKALILAAGYATRLYPLTKEFPKPLLPVGERPIINYIVDKLEGLSILDEIIVVTNSKFIDKFKIWRKDLRCAKKISLVDDLTKDLSNRRGAIGDISFAITKKKIKDDLLVIGGDNLFDGGLERFLSFAHQKASDPVIGVYDIRQKAMAKNYGVIKLDRANKITNFQEKPLKPKSALVAMCLYYFPKKYLGLVQEYMRQRAGKHDATGLYIEWLIKRMAVYGFIFSGRWFDIGRHQFYDEAKEAFAGGIKK